MYRHLVSSHATVGRSHLQYGGVEACLGAARNDDARGGRLQQGPVFALRQQVRCHKRLPCHEDRLGAARVGDGALGLSFWAGTGCVGGGCGAGIAWRRAAVVAPSCLALLMALVGPVPLGLTRQPFYHWLCARTPRSGPPCRCCLYG